MRIQKYQWSQQEINLILKKSNFDSLGSREVDTYEAEDFAKIHHMKHINTSAKTGENITEAFMKLVEMIYDKVKKGIIDAKNGV